MNKPEPGKYRIAVAAERAGISAGLLRAWERRYGLVDPSRTPSGYRVYSEDDVLVLRGARRLTESGLSIAEAARLPRRRLREAGGELVEASLATRAAPAAPSAASRGERAPRAAPEAAEVEAEGEVAVRSFLASAVAAVRAFDGEALERGLLHASGRGALTPLEICEKVLLPLLSAIGASWARGELSIAAEHFGSRILRARLTELMEIESRRRWDGPAAVCACPAGERHEGALLAFAVHAASRGFRVVYLGPDTPIADTLAVADDRDARLCAISVTNPLGDKDAGAIGTALARWKRARPGRRVVVGGRGFGPHGSRLQRIGVEVFDRVGVPLATPPLV